MNTKFMSRQEIPFYGKIVITSNNEDSFIAIEDEETRFLVLKVPAIKKEDPDLMDKMRDEIPAFLQYLKDREIKHPKVTRQWFDYDIIKTEALRNLKDASHSWLVKEIKAWVEEEFFHFQHHAVYYTLTEINDKLNHLSGAKFRKADIQHQLKKKFKLEAKLARYQMPDAPNDSKARTYNEKLGRCYTFFIEDFLSEEKIIEIGYNPEQLRSRRMKQIDIGFPQSEEALIEGAPF